MLSLLTDALELAGLLLLAAAAGLAGAGLYDPAKGAAAAGGMLIAQSFAVIAITARRSRDAGGIKSEVV